jgi:hypothetical protein
MRDKKGKKSKKGNERFMINEKGRVCFLSFIIPHRLLHVHCLFGYTDAIVGLYIHKGMEPISYELGHHVHLRLSLVQQENKSRK